jgi:Arabinose efflux permease
MNSPKPRLWTPSFALACAANFLLGMSFYVLMPTLPFHLMAQLQVDEAVAGGILASYVIAALLVRPFSGFIVERIDAKHAYLAALAAYVLCTAGYLLAASVLAFVFVRMGIGLTFAILSTASNTQAIDIIPSQRRGEGIGYFGLMSSLAMAMGPMAGLWLMDHFPFALIFDAAIASGVGGLVIASFVRSPTKSRVVHSAVLSLDRFLLVRAIPLACNLAVIGLAYGMLLAFAAVYGRQVGAQSTGLFFTLMAIGMMAARAFSGRLVDGGKVVAVINGGTLAIVVGLAGDGDLPRGGQLLSDRCIHRRRLWRGLSGLPDPDRQPGQQRPAWHRSGDLFHRAGCRHRPGHGAGRGGGCPVGDGRSVRQWQCAGAGGRCRVCFFLCPPAAGQRALVIQVLPMPADHKAHRQRSAPWR